MTQIECNAILYSIRIIRAEIYIKKSSPRRRNLINQKIGGVWGSVRVELNRNRVNGCDSVCVKKPGWLFEINSENSLTLNVQILLFSVALAQQKRGHLPYIIA